MQMSEENQTPGATPDEFPDYGLSIFGFSRGAALARAFSNDFLKRCENIVKRMVADEVFA